MRNTRVSVEEKKTFERSSKKSTRATETLKICDRGYCMRRICVADISVTVKVFLRLSTISNRILYLKLRDAILQQL